MIDEGEPAPTFELPALVDGEHRRVGLSKYLGGDVVILAFYPGDFNPACDEESDLDELDLFTMQKDVTVLGIGPDSLYAHEAFADAYDLQVPLLSDTRREVAERYGVAFEGELGQDLVERAVCVIDHDGDVAYAWHTRDVEELPPTEAIKDAIGETGGDETAFARYRMGHAHYVEGRRAFTSAMNSFADSEWMIAQSDFQRAREEFTEADDHFDSAVRFVDDELFEEHYGTAEEKATHLWQAADWLAQSASHYSSGRGADGQQLRDDAERPLEAARTIPEPIDPDDWPPEEPPERVASEGTDTFVPDDGDDRPAATLELDESSVDADEGAGDVDTADDGDGEDAGDIDDAELAEIEAELAEAPSNDPTDAAPDERRSVIDGPPGDDGEGDDPEATVHAADHADGGDDSGGTSDDENPLPDGEITEDELAEIGAEIAASDPNGGDEPSGDDADDSGVDAADSRVDPDDSAGDADAPEGVDGQDHGAGSSRDRQRSPGTPTNGDGNGYATDELAHDADDPARDTNDSAYDADGPAGSPFPDGKSADAAATDRDGPESNGDGETLTADEDSDSESDGESADASDDRIA